MMSVTDYVQAAYNNAVRHGFWDPDKQGLTEDINTKLLLIISELTEAMDELRNGHPYHEVYYNGEKPEGFGVELADAVIRIFDLAGGLNLPLEKLLSDKMKYNLGRPCKHGKEF